MRNTWTERLLTLLFPHKCFLCGRIVPGMGWLCAGCALPETESLCPSCGKDWDACICGRVDYDGAGIPLWYTEGVRRGIHRFKYDGRFYYAKFLGELMAQTVLEAGWPSCDLVTYVPMHPKKRRIRGGCPSELLAREVASRLTLPLDNILYHTGNRRAQMEQKGLTDRLENARRSFKGGEQDLTGLRILLVDDILTTGATVSRCAALLKEQGASRVYVCAAATTRKMEKGGG